MLVLNALEVPRSGGVPSNALTADDDVTLITADDDITPITAD